MQLVALAARSLGLALAVLCSSYALAAYPERPVRIVSPFPPGGGVDIVARIVAQMLTDAVGQQAIVDNRPGASGRIGTEIVAKAASDGYTLLLGSVGPNAIVPAAYSNLPYDAIYHKSNEFGERIARNQLLILKNESHFDAASNPADGSHYLESLTAQLAEKALALFKEIEAGGGLLEAFKEGTIQRKIRESADKEQQAFDSGAEILLGTNKYPNPSDRMQDELQLFPFVKVQQRKTLITPLIEKRLRLR